MILEGFLKLPKDKGNQQYHPVTNLMAYNRALSEKYTGVIMAQMLQEWPSTSWLDSYHCMICKEPETR